MYPIFMTLAATLLIAFGVSESDIAPLWLGLIIFALTRQTYSLDSIPAVFSRVFRYLMN